MYGSLSKNSKNKMNNDGKRKMRYLMVIRGIV